MLKNLSKTFMSLLGILSLVIAKFVVATQEDGNNSKKKINNKYVRNMNMIKKKLIFISIFILGGFMSSQDNAFAENENIWKFNLEPNLEKGTPVITAVTNGEPEELKMTLKSLELGTSQTIETKFLKPAKEHKIEFPKVDEDTYIDLTIEQIPPKDNPLFVWRTMLRPEGSSTLSYKGKKEMLPPDDFDEYWERAKNELKAVPLNPKITRIPEKDTASGILYKVELPSVEKTTIVCWYYIPKDVVKENGIIQKRYPAIQIAPGYGAEEPPIDRTDKGFITLSLNPRNHGPSKEYWTSPVEHMMYNISDPEKYYYKLAFLDCLRGIQFLLTRPEVDREKIAVEGGSQGGLFAIATAALEPKIACVCSNVTAFTDYPDGMILALIGHHSAFAKKVIEQNNDVPKIIKSLSYTDGANMATRVKCPVQINMGGQDPVCHYICGIVLYNRLPEGVKKEFNISPNIKHEVPQEFRNHNNRWYEKYLK